MLKLKGHLPKISASNNWYSPWNLKLGIITINQRKKEKMVLIFKDSLRLKFYVLIKISKHL